MKAYIKATKILGEDGLTHLQLQQIKMDFNVKEIRMGVDGIHNGNSVLRTSRSIDVVGSIMRWFFQKLH